MVGQWERAKEREREREREGESGEREREREREGERGRGGEREATAKERERERGEWERESNGQGAMVCWCGCLAQAWVCLVQACGCLVQAREDALSRHTSHGHFFTTTSQCCSGEATRVAAAQLHYARHTHDVEARLRSLFHPLIHGLLGGIFRPLRILHS